MKNNWKLISSILTPIVLLPIWLVPGTDPAKCAYVICLMGVFWYEYKYTQFRLYGFMDFSLTWTILFQYFCYMAFCFMDFSLIWIILAGTNVVHIKVHMITLELDFD